MHARSSARVCVLLCAANVVLGLRNLAPQEDAGDSVPCQKGKGARDAVAERLEAKYAVADRAEAVYFNQSKDKTADRAESNQTEWRPDQALYVDLPKWRSILRSPSNASVPRRLWQLWEQGNQTPLPVRNQEAMRQWGRLNQNWHRTVLDKTTVRDMFPELSALFERIPRTVQARSDLLRISLLAAHGGVWADASVVPLMPLDSFVHQAARPSGFWAWAFTPYEDGHADSWFLVAQKNNPLVVRWRDAFIERWKNQKNFAYFELHHTLIDLVEKDKVVSRVWDRMLKVSEKWPHQCIPGCKDFWATKPETRPPMLKRPGQKGGFPSAEWWAGYRAAVGS